MAARKFEREADGQDRGAASPAAVAWPGPFFIATLPPSKTQKRLALTVCAALLAVVLVTIPVRDVPFARWDLFVPLANLVIVINDGLTTALLLAQFSVTRNRALLVLASGFLFRTLLLIAQALTFPGAFAATGLLGAGLQTAGWLYACQQKAFLVAAIAYSIMGDRHARAAVEGKPVGLLSVVTVSAVVLLALCTTWLLTVGGDRVPRILSDPVNVNPSHRMVESTIAVLMALASIVVFRRSPKSILDLWFQVAVWA